MTTEITLTDKQTELLRTAAGRFDGAAYPAAAHLGIRGGAFGVVTGKLQQNGLLEGEGAEMLLTDAAYAHLGIERPIRAAEAAEPSEAQAPESNPGPETASGALRAAPGPEPEGTPESPEPAKPRKLREGTKQAQVVEMLKREEGATIAQIMEATGWQIHTTRAVLSRTIPKDLGIALTSEKSTGEERVYRVRK